MANNALIKHGVNIIKTGILLIASTALTQILKESTNETIASILKDVRKIRTYFTERNNFQH